MIRIILALLVSLGFVGCINGQDVKRCIANGSSPETCYATINP